MTNLQSLYDAILNGDDKAAAEITGAALAENAAAADLVSRYLIPAMDEVGKRFGCEEFYIPDVMLASRAMKSSMDLLRPHLAKAGTQPAARVIIGTVKGDNHDIGKNLVASMLEGGGFEVHDLGTDVDPEKFISAIKECRAQIVCLSALLTLTMPAMKTVIEKVGDAGLRPSVKIIVGGAPVTMQFARDIGADEYGATASDAVSIARRLIT